MIKILLGALCGAVLGVAGAYVWFAWYMRDTFR